jgi:hypothetical protein
MNTRRLGVAVAVLGGYIYAIGNFWKQIFSLGIY